MSLQTEYKIKETSNLSARIQWLRAYYFKGVQRKWNNEVTSWSTGKPWDFLYEENSFYIVPETYAFFSTFQAAFKQNARIIALDADFWRWSIAERKVWFLQQVLVKHLPQEILPGDLIAGGRFNVQTSTCLNEKETRDYRKRGMGKNGARESVLWFHNHGYGNAGAVSAHLLPGYERIIKEGWQAVHNELEERLQALDPADVQGPKGAQLRAMRNATILPRELASVYRKECLRLADEQKDVSRKQELLMMAENLVRVPWHKPENFWEAVQSLWLTHMIVMSEENYPGAGLSFGRLDQYLYPLWQKSLDEGMDREFGKEILKCFWIHCNTAYDFMIRTGGNQGITAGYGQLFTISGVGPNGEDMSNDLTYALLEVIDEMSPILEPKPNVRLHRNTPDALYDRVIDMIASSQGAPFLLNFDERSMAGMMEEARKGEVGQWINPDTLHDYAPVGCLENTMVGNDRSGTVDANLNLLKAVELTLTGGYDLDSVVDAMSGKVEKRERRGAATPDASSLKTFEEFWDAYVVQTKQIIHMIVELYEKSESIRADYSPTPYLSCLVKGCAEKGLDITRGGPELNFVTIETIAFANTVDSLLAVKYLVYDKKVCTMAELLDALRDNWQGHEVLQAIATNKVPKYGRDEDQADDMASAVMQMWSSECWQYRTRSSKRQFRPGMLSWNYWIAYAHLSAASPDGRIRGKFLSNAICPVNGTDSNGPTANVNSVGKVLGGKAADGIGDWQGYVNCLPNGASHTITFNPSLVRDPEHKQKFKAFLKGYVENGGTALQINMLDANMLRDAQKHPENYRHLLVRVTGYNAYFTTIGKELQDEIIARETHNM